MILSNNLNDMRRQIIRLFSLRNKRGLLQIKMRSPSHYDANDILTLKFDNHCIGMNFIIIVTYYRFS